MISVLNILTKKTKKKIPPISIDLRNLTEQMLEESKPYMGSCSYKTCIIGRLVENYEDIKSFEGTEVWSLIEEGNVTCPDDQVEDIINLQRRFDDGKWEGVLNIAKPYIKS